MRMGVVVQRKKLRFVQIDLMSPLKIWTRRAPCLNPTAIADLLRRSLQSLQVRQVRPFVCSAEGLRVRPATCPERVAQSLYTNHAPEASADSPFLLIRLQRSRIVLLPNQYRPLLEANLRLRATSANKSKLQIRLRYTQSADTLDCRVR